MLLGLSSPYARRGVLYEVYRRHFGGDSGVLVWQDDTRTMNPAVPELVITEAYERDPDRAAAEYGAQFRSDIEAFVQRDVVEAAMRDGPLELPYDRRHRYQAFVDPAGGGSDEFTLAIGHLEDGCTVVDVLRARCGTPAAIVAEYATLLQTYGVRQALSDRYAGSWPADEFARHGIRVRVADQAKSELYLDALAALNSGRVELPPDDRLQVQLTSLERRTSRGGRDSIDDPLAGTTTGPTQWRD